MDINCERCGTEHEIDETQLPETAVPVRCSSCSHVFSVQRPPDDGFRILRDASPLATCPDLATVQRWVVEGRLLRADELDAKGVRTRLGDVPELESFFAAVDAAQQAQQAAAAAPSLVAPLFVSTNPSFPMPDFSKSGPGATDSGKVTGSTLQYQALTETEPGDQAVTQVAMPALNLSAAPTGGASMKFAATTVDHPEKTPALPYGVPSGGIGGPTTSPFAVPASSLPAETLVNARVIAVRPEQEHPASGAVSETAKFQAVPKAPVVAAASKPGQHEQSATPPSKARSASPSAFSDDDDPEILAFKQRGQGQRRAFFAILLLVLIGAVGWFGVRPLLTETVPVDAEARAASEKKAGTQTAKTAKAPPSDAEKMALSADTEQPKPEPELPTSEANNNAVATASEETETAKAADKSATKTAMATPRDVANRPAPAQPAGVNVDGFVKAGEDFLRQGNIAKAEASFNEAVKRRPTHVEALYWRGVARFDLGRTDDAIVDLKKALELSPRFGGAMIVLAEAFKTKNDVKRARVWYENYLETMPNGEDARTARANLDRLK